MQPPYIWASWKHQHKYLHIYQALCLIIYLHCVCPVTNMLRHTRSWDAPNNITVALRHLRMVSDRHLTNLFIPFIVQLVDVDTGSFCFCGHCTGNFSHGWLIKVSLRKRTSYKALPPFAKFGKRQTISRVETVEGRHLLVPIVGMGAEYSSSSAAVIILITATARLLSLGHNEPLRFHVVKLNFTLRY